MKRRKEKKTLANRQSEGTLESEQPLPHRRKDPSPINKIRFCYRYLMVTREEENRLSAVETHLFQLPLSQEERVIRGEVRLPPSTQPFADSHFVSWF